MHASNHRSVVVVVVGRKKKEEEEEEEEQEEYPQVLFSSGGPCGLGQLQYCWAGYYRNDGYCTRETAWDIGLKRKSSSSYCCCP